MCRIPIVDGDRNVLGALRQELHKEYQVESFDCPEAVLEHSAAGELLDLVMAAWLVPQMDGVEFLRRFLPYRPDCIRLMIGGMSDMSAVSESINWVHVYRFLTKPRGRHEMKNTVSQEADYGETNWNNISLAQLVSAE